MSHWCLCVRSALRLIYTLFIRVRQRAEGFFFHCNTRSSNRPLSALTFLVPAMGNLSENNGFFLKNTEKQHQCFLPMCHSEISLAISLYSQMSYHFLNNFGTVVDFVLTFTHAVNVFCSIQASVHWLNAQNTFSCSINIT